MPPMKPQKFRLPEELWDTFTTAVAANGLGTTPSQVLRQFIRWYVHDPTVQPPARPDELTVKKTSSTL